VVAGAPEFSMPAYVAYPLDRQGAHVSSAIEIMHRIAAAQTRQPAIKRGARKQR
jgi:LysR family transcriptional regulator, flagellar master operon regulator